MYHDTKEIDTLPVADKTTWAEWGISQVRISEQSSFSRC